MIRLLITDDHPVIVSGLQCLLDGHSDIQIVGVALSAADTLAWLCSNSADVLLLDISLPDMDGIDLCKKIHQQYPYIKIIGFTAFGQINFVTSMIRNGALGFLFKNTSKAEIIEAVKTVYRGNQYLSREVNEKLIAKATKTLPIRSSFIPELSRREKEVLELIVKEHTTKEIAEKLYLAVSTIETHRINISTKLGARNTAGLVRNAIKLGLV